MIGCSSSYNIPNSKDYMPLSVGNKWIYGSTSEYILERNKIEFKMEVVEIDTIRSKNYYKIRNEYYGADSSFSYYYYQRISADTLYSLHFDSSDNSYLDYIEAIFSLNIGDTTCIYSRNNLAERCAGYIQVTKKSENEIEFLHNSIDAIDEEQWYTYKRGLGIVIIRSAWGGHTELLDYEIH
jgi:hypothetical protein